MQGEGKQREFESLMQRLERGGGGEVEETCRQLEALIRGLRIPQQACRTAPQLHVARVCWLA